MTLEGAAEVLASIFRGYHSSSSNSLPPSLLPSLPPFQRVPPGNEPSPSLEGSACLYVLLYPPPSSALLTPPSFYVGETESARQRLAQHRATHKKKSRIPESDLEALFVPVASKTEARNLEALLINALARRGFPLSSEADGRRAVGR
ncbi:hypothetical protein NSK_007581 [Nannochloropsis salina CCMP1776]|uniref:GIY-YIG domain-containing protein n=1 Tax=Nannochloropsis salina CCMP1776 TaxID=1027361 RepID=A0A4D9CWI1_9STRA|nr:hypothetical protein NSK_007581 [Nannochloropsis salina CCMP1776]|eukprot:TFJ80938.1 hypothetical protein NSK_007581 [Nannochloropsis salina CCMP1776]